MARGGRRAGTRGRGYGQRTDLHSPLPIAAPTGLPYGARGELIASQRAVPMAPAPSPLAPAGGGGGAPAAPPPAGPFVAPGEQHILRPTERPNEPVTAGLPTGPGPGPEALGPFAPSLGGAGGSISSILQGAAAASGSDVLTQLANQAQALGQ